MSPWIMDNTPALDHDHLPLFLLNSDVLTTPADALLITVDGQARGLRGNIARAFIRRWLDAYEDFDSRLEFPISLGSVGH